MRLINYPILISAAIGTVNASAIAQLPPPREPEKSIEIPIPESPVEVPFEVEPAEPMQNDSLPPVRVRDFRIIGNTAIDSQSILKLTDPYFGQLINQTDLNKITDGITKLYRDKGFLTSGAVYLQQDNLVEIDPENAVLTIRVIEGRLGNINITGSKRLTNYVKRRISKNKPFNSNEVLKDLKRLNTNPLLKSVKGKLIQDPDFTNRSILDLEIQRAKEFELSLFLRNHRNLGIGEIERGIDFTALNPTTLGDRFSLLWSNTDGSNLLFAGYEIPINRNNTTLDVGYAYGENRTIAEPFKVLDIKGTTQSYTFGITQPIFQHYTDKANSELKIRAGIQHRQTSEQVLDFNVPVSQGSNIDGQTTTTDFNLRVDYTRISAVDAALLRAQFNLGIDLGSSTDPLFNEGQFFSTKLDGIYTHKLPAGLLFISRLSVQVANRDLVAGYRFPLGGIYSVRGYRQDAILTDNGVSGSVSLSIPIYKGSAGNLNLVPFFDIGYGWSADSKISNQSALLASPGVSLEYHFLKDRISASLSWAYPLFSNDFDRQSNALQDSGIYFSVNFGLL
jgi:hemolysin activation/secretion protein